jgi:hypothetical protein
LTTNFRDVTIGNMKATLITEFKDVAEDGSIIQLIEDFIKEVERRRTS